MNEEVIRNGELEAKRLAMVMHEALYADPDASQSTPVRALACLLLAAALATDVDNKALPNDVEEWLVNGLHYACAMMRAAIERTKHEGIVDAGTGTGSDPAGEAS